MPKVIGIPKEIKDQESRVSLQPDGVAELAHHGHNIVVESGAGAGAGFPDEEYEAAGARLLDSADEVFDEADLIVKVKEPVLEEYDRYKEGQELFTYLHLAADKGLTEFLDGEENQLHSLRNRRVRRRHPAAFEADERGSRQDGDPGRRPLPGEPARRSGPPARRRPRHTSSPGNHHRWRRSRNRSGQDSLGDAGHSKGAGHRSGKARLPFGHLRGAGRPRHPKPGEDRRIRRRVRRSHRSGLSTWGRSAEAREPGDDKE